MNTPRMTRTEHTTAVQRERTMSLIGGVLGVLMFFWGFMRWFEVSNGADEVKYSGFAFQTPSSAVIGFGLAAGIVAALGATERRVGRGVPSAIPAGLAATSFLLALGVWLGKDQISPDGGADVGVEVGLILAFITSLLQTIVLGMVLTSRHDDEGAPDHGRPRAGAV